MIYVYTSFTYSYLGRARVLGHSLRRHHPDWHVVAVITDLEPDDFVLDPEREPFDEVILGQDLLGPDARSWLFRHDIVEVCTGVKGPAAVELIRRPEAEAVIYLDPDTVVFNPLTPVVDALDSGSAIVLTPHQLAPEQDVRAILDNEITALNYGVYNLGFLALNASVDSAHQFAAWWASRLENWCKDDRANGIFVDQKWCDLAPALFDNVCILRDPGCNVASWNLSNRQIEVSKDGAITVNGHPLRFYHFTKLGSVGETMTARYAAENTAVFELWCWYRNSVERFTDNRIPKGWWGFNYFSNGTRINDDVRDLYSDRHDLQLHFADPFQTGTGNGLLEWVQSKKAGVQ